MSREQLYNTGVRHAHLRRSEQEKLAEDGTCRQPEEVVDAIGVRMASP
jgi:hypothetical protein